MKKSLLLIICLLFAFLALSLNRVTFASTQADSGIPYQTYTLGNNGRIIPTQTAYIPVGAMGKGFGLNSPQDIYYRDGRFYIADTKITTTKDADNKTVTTKAKRILVINAQGEMLDEFLSDEFVEPMGVFANDEYLFVADKGARTVFQIDLTTKAIVLRITKPTSPIYGQKNDFLPIKVAVGDSDSIYIVGEGSTSGIIQVNYAGEFVGYLGINTVPFSFRKMLYNLFVKDSKLASSKPASPTNVAIGEKGSILTTNINVNETFKRLNNGGINTLLPTTFYPNATLSDIWMNSEHYIYMVAGNGDIYEYDASGNLLFFFNTLDSQMTQALGLTTDPVGIVTDDAGNLYVLDRKANQIDIYQRTVFVDIVHEAVTLYNDGKYVESKPIWEEILRQNTSFALAHSALGEALVKEGRYQEALQEFYDGRDYGGYSNAYWQIRNLAIQNNLSTWVIVLISALVILKIMVVIFRHSALYPKYLNLKERLKGRKLVSELALSTTILKRPNDLFYYIKRKNKASYRSGFIVLFLFVIVYLVDIYGRGFLFRSASSSNSVLMELVVVFGIFFLYVVVNYLISSLSDGEGRFKDVFISSCYALMPFIIFTLPMTFLSHFLTYNESFIFDFYHQLVLGWTLILFIMTIRGIHNYRFWETVRNILIIIFGMFIVILIGLLIYTFMGQLIDFVTSVLKEVVYRV